ncbi:glycosyltransferase family 1 protein [Bacteroides fragilis]|nr:glycosyltransferase family 1 protein [Bacteroides fragilis]
MRDGKPIEILHIVGTRPVGGIGALLKNINTSIDLNKFHFTYVFSADSNIGDFDNYVRKLGSDIVVFPSYHLKYLFLYLKVIFCFYKRNAKKYDIIHVHSANTGVLDLLFAKIYGIRIRILHSHSTKYSSKKIRSIRNYFLQFPTIYLANTYFACGYKAAEFLFGKKRLEKVYIIHNAIFSKKIIYNATVRERVRVELKIENDCLLLGHIGNFTKEKNHGFLIDILEELLNINDNVKLLLVGDGQLRSEIEEKVKLKRLQKYVCFLGRRTDISELLQAMDFLIFPSFFEGLPVTLIEAQASGLRCVVSDRITLETKITNNISYLNLNRDPSTWAEVVWKLFEDKTFIRKDTSKEICESGYDIHLESEYLERIYLNLLHK